MSSLELQNKKLQQLCEQFLSGLPERAAELLAALTAWEQADSVPRAQQAQQALILVLHRFSGAAGLYGFAEASRAASDLEWRVANEQSPPGAATSHALHAMHGSMMSLGHSRSKPDA